MSVLNQINHDELQQILAQLDQALYHHQQWHNAIIRILVCRLPCDKHDLRADAHKQCRFGQWYYSDDDTLKKIAEHEGFTAIGKAHQQMHYQAAGLLNTNSVGSNITPLEFDHFANVLDQLRLEIVAFKNEIQNLLYNRDPLTGAINRVNILQNLREQQEITRRQNKPCCLAMIDLDLFKNVNDQYGHQVGDKVLSTVAHHYINNIRSYDKIFRFGGEEFLICMPFTDINQGNIIIDDLRNYIASHPTEIDGLEPIYITVSGGITLLDEHSPVELSIEHADKALYQAKTSGRNCTKIWGQTPQ
ncbi:MAG: diguanylate cyclase [Gammaproteobacteria bacterium]|jgi:diguanylate cyclase (GGDEF)-like protein|nr:diguanylate cyclase [Gammaproteobacteria bacterium]